MRNGPVRVGLLGCGWMGERHAQAYMEMERAGVRAMGLVATCDEDRARAQRQADMMSAATGRTLSVYDRLEDMLAADVIDAVDIVVPTVQHHDAVAVALEAGRHVMVEKPLAITVRACLKIAEAAHRSDRVVAVAENFRRVVSHRALKAVLDSNAIGDPYFSLVHYVVDSAELLKDVLPQPGDQHLAWYFDRMQVGNLAVLELAVHEADLLRCWFGDAESVFGMAASFCRRPAGPYESMEDTALGLIRFRSGLLVQLAFSVAGHGADLTSRRIYGSKGCVSSAGWMGWENGAVHLRDGRVIESGDEIERYFHGLDPSVRNRLFPQGTISETDFSVSKFDPLRFGVGTAIYDFADAIRTGRPPEVGVTDGHKAVALAYSVLEAHACGEPVRVEDVENGSVAGWQEPIDVALSLV